MKLSNFIIVLFISLIFTNYSLAQDWRNEILIDADDHFALRMVQTISVSSGIIHVVSHSGSPESECHWPFYVRSADGGITWNEYPISAAWPPPHPPPMHSQSALVAHGNKVIALFYRGFIERVTSNDGGFNWSNSPTILGYGQCPTTTKALDGYYAFWQDQVQTNPVIEELFFKKSSNGDDWWSYNPEPGRTDSAQRVTYTNGKSNFSDIASGMLIENGEECQFLHLVWSKLVVEQHDYDIFYNFSYNGEEWTYGTGGHRITWTERPSLYPAVACYPPHPSVHCVWQEGEGDEAQIWYAGSMNNGQTWSEPTQLAVGEHPDIAVDHQGVHIVFSSHWFFPPEVPPYSESEIYYINSPDYGNTWQPVKRLTYANHNSEYPKIAADPQGRHIVFVDWRQATSRNPQLWYKQNDILPPAPPRNLRIKYITEFETPNQVVICLDWISNTEPDLAGYDLYRRPWYGDWQKISNELITENAYFDTIPYNEVFVYYVVAIDQAENTSDPSNFVVYWPPDYKSDIGKSEPSIYLLERDSFIQWENNSAKTADIDNSQLIYRFQNLNPDMIYELGVVYYQGDNEERTQVLKINNVELQEITVPTIPEMYVFRIPKTIYANGEMTANIEKLLGPNVVVSEIYLWEFYSGSGSQSGGRTGLNQFGLTLSPSIFKNSTMISYDLPFQTNTSLKIYNSSGRLVKTLQNGSLAQSNYRLTWDGKDDDGRNIPIGIYFVNLTIANKTTTKRIALVR